MIEPQRYLSYLLRLWQVGGEERQTWRASLESPGTGRRLEFASLKDLFGFLQSQIDLPESRLERDSKNCDASRTAL